MGLCSPAECNCVINVLDTSNINFSRSGSGSVADPTVISGVFDAGSATNYTPTVWQGAGTPNVAKTINSSFYMQLDDLVLWWADLSITGAGTGGQFISISLPFTAHGDYAVNAHLIGNIFFYDSSASTRYDGSPELSVTRTYLTISADAGLMGGGGGPALASGDIIRLGVMYRKA